MTTVREREAPASSGPAPAGRKAALVDYATAYMSREASLIGRREVMSGKAKFGIFGDGKEIPQVAMARAWRKGDFRSGYYRDQTLFFALGTLTLRQFFAQLYANPDPVQEPHSSGRQMNCHFATPLLTPEGEWLDATVAYNSTSDLSPTGSQMPRLVGLSYASVYYRAINDRDGAARFSAGGSEVAWGTIGNATCAEGMFWEALNAVGVLGGPMVLSIWDDGYGISVPNSYQIAGGDLSQLLSGFQRQPGGTGGLEVRTVSGWDYPALLAAYRDAADRARAEHVPTVVHVTDLTQPQGHSTSGSHERYKSSERLQWEESWDGLRKMREWLLNTGLASAADLDALERQTRAQVEAEREAAWEELLVPLRAERSEALELMAKLAEADPDAAADVKSAAADLASADLPLRRNTLEAMHRGLVAARHSTSDERRILSAKYIELRDANRERYAAHLYADGSGSAVTIEEVAPEYGAADMVMGFEVVNAAFDAILARDWRVVAFGEDVGRIGDVNQGFRGLQEKYGQLRVSDTGIREATILGQAIGMALRGLRPICEIQYLDYVLYALQIMSDDLATLRWRSAGSQAAPVIVRTRGHRLEGIWHAGSPMAGILNLVRGMHVLVPRDMTRAAGFYNTLLAAEEPAIVVEVLNGYRIREPLPANIGELRVPLGRPEVLRDGSDVTVVTYGACCRVAMTAAERLAVQGIDAEIVDVQTLLPFDLHGRIGRSLEKTGRVVFLDEDVPGGTTAMMMQEVLERQNGLRWLDSAPRTLSATAHRPAYGSDGDYFSKPSVEDVFDTVYELMSESDPARFPDL